MLNFGTHISESAHTVVKTLDASTTNIYVLSSVVCVGGGGGGCGEGILGKEILNPCMKKRTVCYNGDLVNSLFQKLTTFLQHATDSDLLDGGTMASDLSKVHVGPCNVKQQPCINI